MLLTQQTPTVTLAAAHISANPDAEMVTPMFVAALM